jgi:hypothetical protein
MRVPVFGCGKKVAAAGDLLGRSRAKPHAEESGSYQEALLGAYVDPNKKARPR